MNVTSLQTVEKARTSNVLFLLGCIKWHLRKTKGHFIHFISSSSYFIWFQQNWNCFTLKRLECFLCTDLSTALLFRWHILLQCEVLQMFSVFHWKTITLEHFEEESLLRKGTFKQNLMVYWRKKIFSRVVTIHSRSTCTRDLNLSEPVRILIVQLKVTKVIWSDCLTASELAKNYSMLLRVLS